MPPPDSASTMGELLLHLRLHLARLRHHFFHLAKVGKVHKKLSVASCRLRVECGAG